MIHTRDLLEGRYYHGRIDRDVAVALLENREDGTFLLRMSTSQDDVYTISMVYVRGLPCMLRRNHCRATVANVVAGCSCMCAFEELMAHTLVGAWGLG